jgi:hypothetical protein
MTAAKPDVEGLLAEANYPHDKHDAREHLIERLASAVRTLSAQLAVASDPRHITTCDQCGRVLEVPCELEAKLAESDATTDFANSQSAKLSQIVNIIKGEPEPLHQHSTHDVVDLVAELARTEKLARRYLIESGRENTALRSQLADRDARLAELEGNDAHPENRCQQCGGRNIVWHAPSEVWNRYARTDEILCPICFALRAESSGRPCAAWRLDTGDGENGRCE